MIDREKVIKGLECCTQHGSMGGRNCCGHWGYTDASHTRMELIGEYRAGCTYGSCETGCVKTLAKDALSLLKAQEPRLLTFEDFDNNPEVDSKGRLPAWVEHNWKGGPSLTDDGYAAVTKQEMENWDRSFIRWWTSRPNKAQMEAIPWE